MTVSNRWSALIVDSCLPDGCGVGFAANIATSRGGLPVIIVVKGDLDPNLINRVAEIGFPIAAKGGDRFEALLTHFVSAASRGVHPKLAFWLKRSAPPWRLSAMEMRIVIDYLAGSSRKEVAAHAGVAESTIKTHVEHILRKTNMRTMDDLRSASVAMGDLSAV